MAENDPTTPQAQETEEPGPKTIAKVQEQLGVIIAFAFLGKRAAMPGDYFDWEPYLKSINCPYDEGVLMEMAFEGLLKMTCAAWQELFSPEDVVKGIPFSRLAGDQKGGAA